jgi:hypothetical protein
MERIAAGEPVAEFHGGVIQNYREAQLFFALAAERGDSEAEAYLAAQYEEGHGVPKDLVRAVHWYKLAAIRACPTRITWRQEVGGSSIEASQIAGHANSKEASALTAYVVHHISGSMRSPLLCGVGGGHQQPPPHPSG